jgi:hypothetical protein
MTSGDMTRNMIAAALDQIQRIPSRRSQRVPLLLDPTERIS